MKKLFCLLLAALMVVGLFAGCGGNSAAEAPVVEAPAADAPAAENREPVVINMAMNSAWADLIPYNQSSGGNYSNVVLGLLYDRLYTINPDGSYGPRGAKSWEIGEDKMSITFHLDENAKWHDGESVTASDYVFAAKLITDPACPANAKNYYYIMEGTDDSGNADGTPLGVEAIDEYTVKYTFSEVISEPVTFTLYLQHYMALPEHLLGDIAPADYLNQELWNAPIGAGPLKFESTIPGSSLTLVCNEDYQLGAPKFDKLNITVMNSDSSIPGLLSGDLDLIYPIPSKDNFTALEGCEHLSYVYRDFATNQKCIYTNNVQIPDARVRKAMDLAIDRESVAALLGGATPISTPVSLGSPYLDPSISAKYDPDAARALLEECIADGAYDPSDPLVLATSGSSGEKLASFVQQNLQAVGFNVEVQLMESATMFAGFYDGSVDMGTITKPSAMNPMYMRTALSDKRQSYIGWQTSLWDEIASEFMLAKNAEEEQEIMTKFQETWLDVVPSIFMAAEFENYAYNKRLGDGESLGLENGAYGCVPVWTWNVKG